MKKSIISAIVGAVITGVFSIALFYFEKRTTENETIGLLANYFSDIDEDMAYEEALKIIYQDQISLSNENTELKEEIDELKQVNNQEANDMLDRASAYAQEGNYAAAISQIKKLTNIDGYSVEIDALLKEYSSKYEMTVEEQAKEFLSEQKNEDASVLVGNAMKVIPESEGLKTLMDEIERSYPQNMIEVSPAYESGGNPYKEYSSSNLGATESFLMAGIQYTNGMTFNADINIFDDVSWALYNLDGKYETLEFVIGHVDGTDIGHETYLQIYYNGNFSQEILLKPDMIPQSVTLNVTDVKQLKLQVPSSGAEGPRYGIGNPILRG